MNTPTSEQNHLSRFRMALRVAGVALVVVVLTVAAIGMYAQYRALSAETLSGISNVYLKEVSEQLGRHLQTNLNSQFSQLDTIAYAISVDDLSDETELQATLHELQARNDFAYLALIDEEGNVHTATGVTPGISRISGLNELLGGSGKVLSFNETIWDENVLLLGLSIEPMHAESGTFSAIIAGVDGSSIVQKLTLENENSEIHATILDKNGATLIRYNTTSGWHINQNLFSALTDATFDKGYSMDSMQNDFAQNTEGMQIVTVPNGEHLILYYCPVSGTDWFICTHIAVPVVEGPISDLNRFLTVFLMTFFGIVLLLFVSFFFFNLHKEKQNGRRLKDERDRANEATRAKSQFLSNMSHEIRTPINGIIGLTDMSMKAVAKPNKTEEIKPYLEKIDYSARHLLSIINDILDISKIESGKVSLDIQPFPLSDLIKSQVIIFTEQANSRGVHFEVVIDGEVEQWLLGDSMRLKQILTNLLSNAIKFTDAGGTVVLYLKQEAADETHVTLRIEVRDTGCGIAPENFDRIFESFEQERKDTTRRYGGTGLGLPITKSLVEEMRGSISVQSEPGKGSTFTVLLSLERHDQPDLPLSSEQPRSFGPDMLDPAKSLVTEPATTAPSVLAGKRVLLAEDNDINMMIAARIFSDCGALVSRAKNGQEAFDAFAASEPGCFDLIMMDMQMPIVDGCDATRRIRALDRPDAATVLIFAMTVNAYSEDRERCLQSGMNDHIAKPFELADVERCYLKHTTS